MGCAGGSQQHLGFSRRGRCVRTWWLLGRVCVHSAGGVSRVRPARRRAKSEADQLAAPFGHLWLDGGVARVILLDRRARAWVVTPLNVVPKELTSGVRRRGVILATAASRELDAPVQVEILDVNDRPAVLLSAPDADQ
jgi:hypothetical protein